MYNCVICKHSTQPNQTQLKLVEYHMADFKYEDEEGTQYSKEIMQIKREHLVCPACYDKHKEDKKYNP